MATTPLPPSLPNLPAWSTMVYNLPSIVDRMTDLYVEKLKSMPPGSSPAPVEAQLELLQCKIGRASCRERVCLYV